MGGGEKPVAKLEGIQACVFDAYGTLFDVHAAVRRHADAIGPDGQLLSEIWRAKQLEYSWVRTLMGAYVDFWQLTEQALDFALRKVPSADPSLKAKLLEAYWRLDCYPEVPAVLKALKASGARLAILSNGSPDLLEPLVLNSGLSFDAVLSVDALKVYKPAPQVYELAVKHLKIPREGIGFVSSNCWDAIGAKSYGFRVYWVNRAAAPLDRLGFQPDEVVKSLDEILR
jgi:2-haloacid dehalogenase